MPTIYVARARVASRDAGFTMLEILVTLFVIAIGVLGTATLQAFALKMSHGGQMRSQAVILGLDLLERIEANNPGMVAGSYAPASLPTSYAKDCTVDYCLANELATYDLVEFKNRLEAQLPAASATITLAGTGPYTYTIQINWEERISKGASTTVATGGTTTVGVSGKTESFSYTISKMYPNRSIVL
jgi:type IV pilus assembly protein PilV